jgi:hypothetical protein
LADCALGAAACPCSRTRSRREAPEESALPAVSLEDLRQPPAQPRACGIDGLVAARLDALVAVLALDPGGVLTPARKYTNITGLRVNQSHRSEISHLLLLPRNPFANVYFLVVFLFIWFIFLSSSSM